MCFHWYCFFVSHERPLLGPLYVSELLPVCILLSLWQAVCLFFFVTVLRFVKVTEIISDISVKTLTFFHILGLPHFYALLVEINFWAHGVACQLNGFVKWCSFLLRFFITRLATRHLRHFGCYQNKCLVYQRTLENSFTGFKIKFLLLFCYC